MAKMDAKDEARYDELNQIQKKNGGFDSKDEAKEYGLLRKKWWGDNLVLLNIEKNNEGKWNQYFNVWD